MQFLKTAFLILSATSAVSAEFAPRITNFNGGASVKNINIFQRNPSHNMFQNLQMAGRRLEGHEEGAAFSAECAEACSGAADLVKEYMKEENQEAMKKGDMSWMCPSMDTVKCMNSAKACQDGEDKEDDDGMAEMDCLCACPGIAKMHEMKPKDYCEAGNAMECVSTKTECSDMFKKEMLKDGSKADWDEGMSINCAMIENECEKKGTEIMTCGAAELETWGKKGCEEAAVDGKLDTSENKDDCCTAGKKIVTCYDGECVKLSMRYSILKAKDATAEEKKEAEKELNKNYHLGKVCPDAGMPASEADLKPPPAATADGAWMSLPHAIPFVAMLNALYA